MDMVLGSQVLFFCHDGAISLVTIRTVHSACWEGWAMQTRWRNNGIALAVASFGAGCNASMVTRAKSWISVISTSGNSGAAKSPIARDATGNHLDTNASSH